MKRHRTKHTFQRYNSQRQEKWERKLCDENQDLIHWNKTPSVAVTSRLRLVCFQEGNFSHYRLVPRLFLMTTD